MPLTLDSCMTVKEVIELYEDTDGDDEFNGDVVLRIAEIVSAGDEELSDSLEYRDLMIQASLYCDTLLVEITEALSALEEAYSAEEWDQMTDSLYADWESDEAMSDAAAEVDDVNVLLREFKGFLHDIGESVAGLYGSDFDFGWDSNMNEAFFGDFWGTEMNMDKISQAHAQMAHLMEKVTQLGIRFDNNMDEADRYIQQRVDEEWAKCTG